MAAIALAGSFDLFYLRCGALWMAVILLSLAWSGGIGKLSPWFSRPIVKGIQLGIGLLLLKTSLALLHAPAAHPAAALTPVAAHPHGLLGFVAALWLLVVPQLPLTLGNSVFATEDAARYYFGDGTRVTARRLAVSIGLANAAAGLLGGMPVCHGSGGLTAHYRCGARSAWATAWTGLFCVVLGLACRERAAAVLRAVPTALLGLSLAYVGLCHIWLCRGLDGKRWLVFVVGMAGLLTGNLAVAMALGLLLEKLPPLGRPRAA